MYVTDIVHGYGYNKCRIHLKDGEKYTDEELYRICDNYYTPILGGIITPYGRNVFNVTVYTD